jgi:hypothetical protein
MSRGVWLAAVIVIGIAASSARVAAQPALPQAITALRSDSLRMSAGIGYVTVSGPEVETDGRQVGDDSPRLLPLPASLIARVDYPLHSLLLLGVQGTVFFWEETSDEYFGADAHYTFDTGGVIRLRFDIEPRIIPNGLNEVVVSVPLGPSFDVFDAGPRSYGGVLDNELGWHTGLAVGYQFLRSNGPWGAFVEVGFTIHRLPKTYTYQLEPDRNATEEVIYRPVELFLRAGGILRPFN